MILLLSSAIASSGRPDISSKIWKPDKNRPKKTILGSDFVSMIAGNVPGPLLSSKFF